MADRMQDDAMHRLRQMYSKAPSDSQPDTKTQEHNQPHKSQDTDNKQTEEILQNQLHNQNSPIKTTNPNILDVFMKDKEKSLILLLIVILISEKADTTLVLALMYLVI